MELCIWGLLLLYSYYICVNILLFISHLGIDYLTLYTGVVIEKGQRYLWKKMSYPMRIFLLEFDNGIDGSSFSFFI